MNNSSFVHSTHIIILEEDSEDVIGNPWFLQMVLFNATYSIDYQT